MALNGYLSSVQRLLHDPNSSIYSVSDLTIDINTARNQIALESECIRVLPSGNNTVVGQEVYTFSSVNSLIQTTPGVKGINAVKSVAVSWGTYKPILDNKVWSEFQAYLRSYSTSIQGYPESWSQYAQGASGSIYLWPVPSQISQMDWDCVCSPIDLALDSDLEAIPDPWASVIPYFATFLALLNAQRPTQADEMLKRYDFFMKRARASIDSSFVPSYY